MQGYTKVKPSKQTIDNIINAIETAQNSVRGARQTESYLLKDCNWFRKLFLSTLDYEEIARLDAIPFVFCSDWDTDRVIIGAATEYLHNIVSLYTNSDTGEIWLDAELTAIYTQFI